MNIAAKSDKKFDIKKILRAKHIAVPGEHGAWIFLLSPLAIGLFIGGFSNGSLPLTTSLMAAFLIRQPLTIMVKIKSGRRTNRDMQPAIFWFSMYALIMVVSIVLLFLHGYYFIFYLAAPAIPVFLWHLWLVSKRAERRQKLIEIAAGGVLALAAPAAYWVGKQCYDPLGWMIWFLSWLQVTGTILYAYLRLQQRQLSHSPSRKETFIFSKEAFWFNFLLMLLVIGFALLSWVPSLVPLAFLIQPAEVLWGIYHPAIKVPPKIIGIRQLIISILFTIVFILTWLVV